MDDYIELGKAYKGHGLRGEVKLGFYNPESELKLKDKSVLLLPLSSESCLSKTGEWFKVISLRGKDKMILKLDSFDDLTSVEKILPFTLSVKREELHKLKDDEFLLDDLIGLIVIDDQTQKEMGKVISLREGKLGVNLIFVLSSTQEEIELPFKDQFFPNVDMEKRVISCKLPEYI